MIDEFWVVEHDVTTASNAWHRAFVMDSGRTVLHGPSKALINDQFVREPYLGVIPASESSEYERKIDRILRFHVLTVDLSRPFAV
jgi:energy-coupling factor transporter ATP-binding protein EcfA2